MYDCVRLCDFTEMSSNVTRICKKKNNLQEQKDKFRIYVKSNASKTNRKNNCTEWNDRFCKAIDKHKKAFFMVQIRSSESVSWSNCFSMSLTRFFYLLSFFLFSMNLKTHLFIYLQPTRDPRPYIDCELIGVRDLFFIFMREKRYEFSSLRHTQFSTLDIFLSNSSVSTLIECLAIKFEPNLQWK